jgi:hypothetical protein
MRTGNKTQGFDPDTAGSKFGAAKVLEIPMVAQRDALILAEFNCVISLPADRL